MNELERVQSAPQKSAAQAADFAPSNSVVPAMPAVSAQAAVDQPLRSLPIRARRPEPPSEHGPRFWALPDRNLGWWIVRENDVGAAGLTTGKPVIFTPAMSADDKSAAAECCRRLVTSRLRDVFHADLFNLIKRMLLGGMLCLAGLVGLRVGGEFELFDIPLLLGAMGYSAYAFLRYGARVARSFEASSRPFSHFAGEPFAENALLERLSKALAFRQALPAGKKGAAPDDELLDANAYRALLKSGSVNRAEFLALGAAICARFGLNRAEPPSLVALCKSEGLDLESAALYRDVALAAQELECEVDAESWPASNDA